MSELEKRTGVVPVVTASSERKEVSMVRHVGGQTRQQRQSFNFDEVLTSFSTQAEVFDSTLRPLINEVLSGYEATAFAYGQTGTGKTHTMEGDIDCEEGRGLVPRAAAAILEKLSNPEFKDWSIHVSYLEIYNEELGDLLAAADGGRKLEIMETGRGICCNGLQEVAVSSIEEILDLVRVAQEKRCVAETRMNERSSRSHTIFMLKVRCRRSVKLGMDMGELENVGKLHLVDLAGSECAKHVASAQNDSHQRQARFVEEERERRSINQSLLTLGRVIAALRGESSRVPYRDSKLTRLLQGALGGRCKTIVIATISPALSAVEETLSTLSYAQQASGIKNKPVASSMLKALREPRVASFADGSITAAGGSTSGASFAELENKVVYLLQEVEEAQIALARSYQRVEVAEAERDAKADDLWRSYNVIEESQGSLQLAGVCLEGLRSEASAGAESLAASVQAAIANLEACEAAVADARKSSEERLVSSVRTPLASHAERLRADGARAGSQEHEVIAFAARCDGVATAASERRVALAKSIEQAESSHAASLDVRPAALADMLHAIGTALNSHGDAAATELMTLNARLEALHVSHGADAAVRRDGLLRVVDEADQTLAKAWLAGASDLNHVGDVLVKTAQDQREGNIAQPMADRIDSASAGLEEALSAQLMALAATRQAVAGEVEDLRRLRASEQAAVDLLRRQREALHAEVGELTGAAEGLKVDLAAARGDLVALEDEQKKGRERLMQAIVAAAQSSLETLSGSLDAGAKAIGERLEGGISRASEVCALARRAEEQCADRSSRASEAVAGMGRAIETHCGVLSQSQERAEEAAAAIGQAGSRVSAQHRGLRDDAVSWGESCHVAVVAIDEAVVNMRDIRSGQEATQASWGCLRKQADTASRGWASAVSSVSEELGVLASKGAVAKDALAELHGEVSEGRSSALCHVEAWTSDGKTHLAELRSLATVAENAAVSEADAEAERKERFAALSKEAAVVRQNAARAPEEASTILTALEGHSAALLEEAVVGQKLLDAASAGADGFGRTAHDVLARVETSAEQLGSIHGDATAGVSGFLGSVERPIAPTRSTPATPMSRGVAVIASPSPRTTVPVFLEEVDAVTHIPSLADARGAGCGDAARPPPLPENLGGSATIKKAASESKLRAPAAAKPAVRVAMRERDVNGTR
jgi:kinesin family protein 11